MRDWLSTLRLVWKLWRESRRAVLRYARYGPGGAVTPEEIREAYAKLGDALVKVATGGNTNRRSLPAVTSGQSFTDSAEDTPTTG